MVNGGTSGEHVVPTIINQSTHVPLGWVLSGVGALLVLAATAGSAHWRLGEAEKDVETLHMTVHAMQAERDTLFLRLQRVEDSTTRIEKVVERIEAKLP